MSPSSLPLVIWSCPQCLPYHPRTITNGKTVYRKIFSQGLTCPNWSYPHVTKLKVKLLLVWNRVEKLTAPLNLARISRHPSDPNPPSGSYLTEKVKKARWTRNVHPFWGIETVVVVATTAMAVRVEICSKLRAVEAFATKWNSHLESSCTGRAARRN